VRPELQGKALLVTFGGALVVRASPLRLAQVLINLVVNAGQALASVSRDELGRGQGRWSARGGRGGGGGAGGRPGPAPRGAEGGDTIFTTKAPGVGTGLGLSLCRELVAEMGGIFTLRSLEGQGTTARIDLPLAG